jgi:hypothetical protein
MADISKRLEQVIGSAQKKLLKNNLILPIKTEEGILVGDVLIISEGNIKHIKKSNEMLYVNVYLNIVAIRIANLCAKNVSSLQAQKLYDIDQEYGKWFIDSQILRTQYHKALEKKDFDKADMLFSRYSESRDRAEKAKNLARALAGE